MVAQLLRATIRANQRDTTMADTDSGHGGSASYLARHWRGELSLAQSFWVNGVLVSSIYSALLVVPVDTYITYAPRLVATAIMVLLLVSIPLTIWQSVGAWRSASAPARNGRRFWARVVQAIIAPGLVASAYSTVVIIVPQSLELGAIALGRDEFGDFEVSVAEDGKRLVIEGGIGFGLSDAVVATLERNKGLQTIELWSEGGRIVEARRLAKLVESRSLNTLVVDTCASACTLIFTAGNRRYIADEARLGFHNGSIPGASEAQARAFQFADIQYLMRRGVSADFIEKIYTTPSDELWEPSHAELLRAHVATGYAAVND
jgi:hypothetical protein